MGTMRVTALNFFLYLHPSRLAVNSSPELLLSCLQPCIFCSPVNSLIDPGRRRVASINLDLPTLRIEPPSSTSPIGNRGVEFVSEKQATRIPLRNTPFWPLINITEMVADGSCGFLAVAHIIHGRESVWPEVRQRLLDHLSSNPAGYLRDATITPGVEIFAEPAGEPYSLCWDHLGPQQVV